MADRNPEIGGKEIVSTGTVLLASGEHELSLFLEDMILRIAFLSEGVEEGKTNLRVESQQVAVIEISDRPSPFGSFVAWEKLGELADGRNISLRLYYQTIGDGEKRPRLISYTYGAG